MSSVATMIDPGRSAAASLMSERFHWPELTPATDESSAPSVRPARLQ
jgi:hypothetical protein